MIDIARQKVSLDRNPWTHWTQAPIFEGTGSIPLSTDLIVPIDLTYRIVYLHITTNLVKSGQNVFYGTMNFILKGQVVAAELWRLALGTPLGDNRPNKTMLTNQQTVFTPGRNELTISFPTLANFVIAPHHFNVQCDVINFSISREANLSGGTGRFYFAARSQLQKI